MTDKKLIELFSHILVEEVIEYTTNTKDDEEGIGVRISYLSKDGKLEMICDIDGIDRSTMAHVRISILQLLRFIKEKLHVMGAEP